MTDQEIKQQYNEYDAKFRAAKKRGDYKIASQWKARRDALEAQLTGILKREAGKK